MLRYLVFCSSYVLVQLNQIHLFSVSLQALGLQDSDDEAEAEEKAVEEVSMVESLYFELSGKTKHSLK